MFYLRNEVREVREDRNKADEEIKRLKRMVDTLQDNLDRNMRSKTFQITSSSIVVT